MHILTASDLRPYTVYFLRHERELAEAQLAGLRASQNVADSTNGSRHEDERATAGEAQNILEKRIAPVKAALSGSTTVDYPNATIDCVTIGSRVHLSSSFGKSSYSIMVDVVGAAGFPLKRPDPDDGIDRSPYDSPLCQAIIGHKVGETLRVKIAENIRTIVILAIDQDAQRLVAKGVTQNAQSMVDEEAA